MSHQAHGKVDRVWFDEMLEDSQPAPNPMGGERFTITERHYIPGPDGKRAEVVTVHRNVPFGKALKNF